VVFANLDKIKFKGFTNMESDRVPDPRKIPFSFSEKSKQFLKDTIHYPFS
jgi:hypothetical protein